MEKEVIELWKEKGRLGQTILKEDYDAISEFIFSLLLERDTIELQVLLNEAHMSLFINKDFTRHLLDVKQDLEIKGLITVTRQANRMQFISIVRKNSRDRAYGWGSR